MAIWQPLVPHSQQSSCQGSANCCSSTWGCSLERWMNTSSRVDSLISYRLILPLRDSSSSNSSKALERQKCSFLTMKTMSSGLVSILSVCTSSPKARLTSSVSFGWNSTPHSTLTRNPCPYFSLSFLGLSRQTNCPLMRMPISEQRDQASFMEWVVRTMEVCLDLAAAARHFQRQRLEMGSTPAEGSSKKATSGLPIIAIPTHIFRLLPPLSTPAFTSRYCSSERRRTQNWMVWSTWAAGRPLSRQKYCRCQQTVMLSQMGLYCGHTPTCEKISMIPLFTSCPNSCTLPAVLGSAAVTMLKVVDFPAPLGPSSPKISPCLTRKLLLRRAEQPLPYVLVRFCTRMGQLRFWEARSLTFRMISWEASGEAALICWLWRKTSASELLRENLMLSRQRQAKKQAKAWRVKARQQNQSLLQPRVCPTSDPTISTVLKTEAKATKGLRRGMRYQARKPWLLLTVAGMRGRKQKKMRLRKGKKRKAVLLFWKIKENRQEQPMKEKPKSTRVISRQPALSMMNAPSLPRASPITKNMVRGTQKMMRSKAQLPAQQGSCLAPLTFEMYLNRFSRSSTTLPQQEEVLKTKAQIMKQERMKRRMRSRVTRAFSSVSLLGMARQTTKMPMLIKAEGMMRETTVLNDRRVVLILRRNTACIWLWKEQMHFTSGKINSSLFSSRSSSLAFSLGERVTSLKPSDCWSSSSPILMKASSRLLMKIEISPTFASQSSRSVLEKWGSSLSGKMNLRV